jgi:hypothetical protein
MKKEGLVALSIYALCVALTCLLWSNQLILSGCFALISIFMLLKWNTRTDFLFYFAALILGPAGEAISVWSGAWTYSKPSFLVPLWLPLLWGIAGLFLKRFCDSLASIGLNSTGTEGRSPSLY